MTILFEFRMHLIEGNTFVNAQPVCGRLVVHIILCLYNLYPNLSNLLSILAFDDSMEFGTPNICPMQATPSTGIRMQATPSTGIRMQATPSTCERLGREFGGIIDSPDISPIYLPGSPGITPDYSSTGEKR